jgi:uncharacterized protein with FMN-binding domain
VNPVLKKIVIILILVAVIYPFANRGIRYLNYQRQMDALEVGEINPEQKEDGTYTGRYDVDYIKVEVEVMILNGEIRDISLQHEHERGARAEVIIESVIREQSLNVDTISGATDSSKVILKAIELALQE